ncbi:MAG: metal-transporting ATPase [Spirochaetes bacterium DG_61]|nr:MAG: metal-transporting ATPase [Spirochaetes bacterium DG_61]
MKEINTDASTSEARKESAQKEFNRKKELIIISLSALLMGYGILFRSALHGTPYSAGEYVVLRAGKNIFHGRVFDEYFLMSAATIGAFLIHQLPEAVGVMIFFQIGEFLQDLSLNRSRNSIKSLLDVRPKIAHRKKGRRIEDVNPEVVNPGDTILIKPGEKIPLDGTVIEGKSQIDTSPLTGEPVPKTVSQDDNVLAGMINKTGLLTLRVSRRFKDSSISKILYLVEKATEKKTPTERFISRFARYYTPFVVSIAAALAVIPPLLIEGARFSDWVYRALVLLVISCPCALLISIPLGFFGGVGRASRRGILIKGSNYLDALNSVKTVIFDKTGTLTRGVFKVTDIVPSNGFTRDELIKWAAEAEAHSEHPIARSITESYSAPIDLSLTSDFKELSGTGVRATVRNKLVWVGNDRLLHDLNVPHDICHIEGTVVHVVVDGRYAGYIVISDEIKEDSFGAVHELRYLGVRKIGMLTGDNSYAAEAIAKKLGLDYTAADLLPEGKVRELEAIIHSEDNKEKTVFVGDGINDAPVIARADIGIAIGHLGSDAAIETADVVLMEGSPLDVAEAIRTARKTRKIVWENIGLALSVKGIFFALGIAGVATMWEAVFADMGVALLAIFNSMRILN